VPSPESRLVELGLSLPEAVEPAGEYLPVVRSGAYGYTSGQVPLVAGKLLAQGKLGASVTTRQGQACARQCALNALAALGASGDLSAVTRVVKASVFVASTPDFTEQPQVADGASELLRAVFGDAGRHARSAVSVPALPLDAPVELDLVVEFGGG